MNLETKHPCPSEVLDAIPWYPDEGLRPDQIAAVEAHAAECAECRHEIERVQGLPGPVPAAPDADAVYARVLGMIAEDGPGRVRSRVAPPPRRSRWQGWVPRVAAGAAALVAAVMLGAYFGGAGSPSEPVYRTAAGASAEAGAALDVVFRGDASADEIREILQRLEARIVSGPNALGTYRVALSPDAEPNRAARELVGDGEGSGVATFAEPVLR
ncbi:MAG: zf-HC2 domain-containing protein [Myxococcales bacterium]|nr:zf-HC2 domain-containing protein [Myxococcales bacterium]